MNALGWPASPPTGSRALVSTPATRIASSPNAVSGSSSLGTAPIHATRPPPRRSARTTAVVEALPPRERQVASARQAESSRGNSATSDTTSM